MMANAVIFRVTNQYMNENVGICQALLSIIDTQTASVLPTASLSRWFWMCYLCLCTMHQFFFLTMVVSIFTAVLIYFLFVGPSDRCIGSGVKGLRGY